MMMMTMISMMMKSDQSDPEIWRLTNWPTNHNNNITITIATIVITIATTILTVVIIITIPPS